jgi:SEC-C motif
MSDKVWKREIAVQTKIPKSKLLLCGQHKTLRRSHIVPAFAVRWLKETSATGYLKSFKSKVRVQETKRVYLLCDDCEQILGCDEKTFCEMIFVPYHEQNQHQFDYGPWLRRFIVGQHWKVLVTREEKYAPEIEAIYDQAESAWRQFLLRNAASPGIGEFHLFLSDLVDDTTGTLPEKFNWYFSRGFDFTPVFSEDGMAGVYAMIVKTVTFCFLTPRPAGDETDGTQINECGVVKTGQTIGKKLGTFIVGRASMVDKLPKTLTPRQKQKLFEKARQEPEKFFQSDAARIAEADMRLKTKSRARLLRETAKLDMKGRDRNSECPCGSGRKFKKCHGR